MKRPLLKCLFLGAALVSARVEAGTLSFAPIPPSNSDAGSGIDSSNKYTFAVAAANGPQGPTVNGVPLTPITADGQTVTVGGVTLSAASGKLENFQDDNTDSIPADGSLAKTFQNMVYNLKADDGSEQYILIDPTGLKKGETYDFRLYIRNASTRNRVVNLQFAGDGQAPVQTDFFNEDDATTSSGGFPEPDQAYYVKYRFTWDGETAPGVIVTQKSGSASFCFYAATNAPVTSTSTPPAEVEVDPSKAYPPSVPAAADAPDPVGESDGHDVGVQSDAFAADPSLQKNGKWVNIDGVGTAWQPTTVAADWAPYTDGSWANSDAGWTWNSNEDWGWATYHYGRWYEADAGGWYWIPGSIWAPAWVSWRYGGGYAGWAPLPPDAVFLSGRGVGVWADRQYGIGPGRYNFVKVNNLGAPNVRSAIIERGQNGTIINKTANVTNIVHNRNAIFAGGPNPLAVRSIIKKTGGSEIQNLQVQRENAAALTGGKHTELNSGVLKVSAPVIKPGQHLTTAIHPVATIAGGKGNLGWKGFSDPKIAAHIASESKGLTPQNAPAGLPRSLSHAVSTGPAGNNSFVRPGQTFAKGGPTNSFAPTNFSRGGQSFSNTGGMTGGGQGMKAFSSTSTAASGLKVSPGEGSTIRESTRTEGEPREHFEGEPRGERGEPRGERGEPRGERGEGLEREKVGSTRESKLEKENFKPGGKNFGNGEKPLLKRGKIGGGELPKMRGPTNAFRPNPLLGALKKGMIQNSIARRPGVVGGGLIKKRP